jgi:hypothetical protein
MRRLTLVLAVVACRATGPELPAPRFGVQVDAPFTKTWDAVMDVFATKNIPIKTMDRSSGFIATEEMRSGLVSAREPISYADCGRSAMGMYLAPSHANYNIRVKGDSSRSTVLVSVFWKEIAGGYACTSRGTWEGETEHEIRTRAETK